MIRHTVAFALTLAVASLAAFASTGLAQESPANKTISLVGTWERQVDPERREVKMFADGHLCWVTYIAETGEVVGCGGGTYTYDGTTLKEKYQYSTYPTLCGTEQTFMVEPVGKDSWRQLGETTYGEAIDETYKRAETGAPNQ